MSNYHCRRTDINSSGSGSRGSRCSRGSRGSGGRRGCGGNGSECKRVCRCNNRFGFCRGRLGVSRLSRVRLSTDGYLGLHQRFTGLDALVPRAIKLAVTSTSTGSEPRTTATAATASPRFRDGATFGAYGTDGCRRDCGCVYI